MWASAPVVVFGASAEFFRSLLRSTTHNSQVISGFNLNYDPE